MNIETNQFFAAIGLGLWELIAIVAVLGVMAIMVVAIVSIIVWSNRKKPSSLPPVKPAPSPAYSATVRLCPKCGKTLETDAPQGLCPTCLMKAAFTTAPGSTAGAATMTPPTPTELSADFPQLEILELLGQGGMGMVYKARQAQLDRFVALKILPKRDSNDPAFEERFAREARALAKLNHPNIVGVHDFGKNERYYFFIMEYVDGVNLRQMEQTQRLTPEQAIEIIPKICDALQYAHEEGIVHRDIKPGNILIDKKGRVKIADFGLAKLLGKKDGEAHLTQSNVVMGTPHYMAPEQVNNPLTVDHRADIYSLGVVFYEMLTGELPLGRFAPPSQKVQVDVRLDEVVLRTLESEPARRYQQVSEVRTDVENISGIMQQLPPEMRYAMGGEYRSKITIGGIPLLHIAWGKDLKTGKPRIARGIIAVGDIAHGAFAFGGVAKGGFAFGGVALGIVAVGGLGIGVISLSGMALALLFAYGGFAIAPVAIGGMTAGYFAMGGLAFGNYTLSADTYSREANEFFQGWSIVLLVKVMLLTCIPSFIVPLWARLYARRQITQDNGEQKKDTVPQVIVNWLTGPALGLMVAAGLEVLLKTASIISYLLIPGDQRPALTPNVVDFFLRSSVLLLVSGIIFWGAYKMRTGRSYPLAIITCLLATTIIPANMIGIPIAIWGIVVLLRSDIRKAFRD